MPCDISVGKCFKAKTASKVWGPHFKGSSKVLPNVLSPYLKKKSGSAIELVYFLFVGAG